MTVTIMFLAHAALASASNDTFGLIAKPRRQGAMLPPDFVTRQGQLCPSRTMGGYLRRPSAAQTRRLEVVPDLLASGATGVEIFAGVSLDLRRSVLPDVQVVTEFAQPMGHGLRYRWCAEADETTRQTPAQAARPSIGQPNRQCSAARPAQAEECTRR